MTIPDWQLPPGVDRGLWDYIHAAEMVASYDEQMCASHLAHVDIGYCDSVFREPGRLLDLGCGTGRLCALFAAKGFECVGVDLSDEMLAKARERNPTPRPPPPGGEGEPNHCAPLPLLDSQCLSPPLPPGEGPGGWGSSLFLKANLVEPLELPERSFDYAACLFSTLGMVRGAENRSKVLANAFRVLKPGGWFVLHAHNRFFEGLGRKRVWSQRLKTLFGTATAGDITMSQAYSGAPLTLHHFTRHEAETALKAAGFTVEQVAAIDIEGKCASGARVYGWLMLCRRNS